MKGVEVVNWKAKTTADVFFLKINGGITVPCYFSYSILHRGFPAPRQSSIRYFVTQTNEVLLSSTIPKSKSRSLLLWLIITPLLLLGVVFLTHWIDKKAEHQNRGTTPDVKSGAWGDLQTWDIRLEQPREYSSFLSVHSGRPTWKFGSLSIPAIQQLLVNVGIPEEEASRLVQESKQEGPLGSVIKPDEKFVLGLNPEVRSRLYKELAADPANRFQAAPYYVPNGDVKALFSDHHPVSAKVIPLFSKLCYTRNGYTYFSDPEIVLSELKDAEDRNHFLQDLTSQNAVMMRLLVRPDADIDKPLNYWALSMSGVLMKDLRPLFEAQQRLPQGGSISILYLLPPLVREKLFTTPLPSSGGAKMPDCHWTALNYFNEVPDPRMSDNNYASRYIMDNYYEVAKPGVPGDLVLLLNEKDQVIHSSVYIADDVVFSKNGINYAQPWMLMRINDMIGNFSQFAPVKLGYMRRKGR